MEQYSKVGHVEKMFGQNFSIVTTNAGGADMLGFEQNGEQAFISSSLIVASPGTDEGVDYGTPSLIITDYEGHPMRLTYTLKPGNGLVLGYTYTINGGGKNSLDTLSFEIDNDSIKCHEQGFVYVSGSGIIEGSKYLQASGENDIDVNIENLIDNNRLKTYDGGFGHERITIDAETIIDNDSLKVDNHGVNPYESGFTYQTISVNLPNIIDNKTVQLKTEDDKQVLTINTYQLNKATTYGVGVCKYDGNTIKMNRQYQLYVDVDKLKIAPASGGKGLIKVQRAGVGDLYVDGTGYLRTDPSNMPKCSTQDSSKTNKGFGVCAVDGTTIKASQNGVISVIAGALGAASTSQNGVVRPDGSTITIQPSGIIAVNTENLTKGSAAEYGLVKYDNKTITKNTQGQLTVTNATKWSTDIADLTTMMNGFATQIAALESKLNEFMGTLNAKTTTQFRITDSTGTDISTITITVPNLVTRSSAIKPWNIGNIGKQFTLYYGAGYVFRYKITSTNMSNWLTSSSLIINGTKYAPGTDIKLTSSDGVEASFEFNVQGYGGSKVQRPMGIFNIVFSDANGQPIKSVILHVNNPVNVLTSGSFQANFNTDDSNAFTATNAIQTTTLDKMINTVIPKQTVGISSNKATFNPIVKPQS